MFSRSYNRGSYYNHSPMFEVGSQKLVKTLQILQILETLPTSKFRPENPRSSQPSGGHPAGSPRQTPAPGRSPPPPPARSPAPRAAPPKRSAALSQTRGRRSETPGRGPGPSGKDITSCEFDGEFNGKTMDLNGCKLGFIMIDPKMGFDLRTIVGKYVEISMV